MSQAQLAPYGGPYEIRKLLKKHNIDISIDHIKSKGGFNILQTHMSHIFAQDCWYMHNKNDKLYNFDIGEIEQVTYVDYLNDTVMSEESTDAAVDSAIDKFEELVISNKVVEGDDENEHDSDIEQFFDMSDENYTK